MAKKANKSVKKQEEEPAPAPAPKASKGKATKAPKAASKKADDGEGLLSATFYDKIEQFSQIYQEVNTIIEEGGKATAFDLS